MDEVIAVFRAFIDRSVIEAMSEGRSLTRKDILNEVLEGLDEIYEDELMKRIGRTIVEYEIEQIETSKV